MEVKSEHLPLRMSLSDREVLHGGTEYQLNFEQLEEVVRNNVKTLHPDCSLIQVNINSTGVALVFEEEDHG
jgi:hypothetical protein